MSVLTSAVVLDLWEAGLSMTPPSRAGLLLGQDGETGLASWSVGRRNEALLQRYCAPPWAREAVVDCPACATTLQVSFDPRELPGGARSDRVDVAVDGWTVSARTPTAGDLGELPARAEPEVLARVLLGRCLLAASYRGEPAAADDLPGAVVSAIEDALDAADPAADLLVPLSCQECGATWSESLDPVAFAWSAVETAARRLATDVHTLAHAYGWTEREILDLSPFRRHLYLSAVGP